MNIPHVLWDVWEWSFFLSPKRYAQIKWLSLDKADLWFAIFHLNIEIKLKLFNLPEVRMEFVQFQKADKAFEEPMLKCIETLMAKAKDGYFSDELGVSAEVRKMEKMILDRFGMNLRIFTTGMLAAILPFHLNQHSIFLDKFLQTPDILKSMEELRVNGAKGWVDEATGQVGGVFSEYPSSLYLNFNQFQQYELSPREVMAIIFHELGHFFYGCWVSSRKDKTNLILEDAIKKMSSKKDEERVEFLFKTVKGITKDLPEKLMDDMTSSNPIVVSKAVATIVGEVCYSQLEDAKYSETSFEQMADNFSTRFGYGTELVSALAKIGGDNSFASDLIGSLVLTYKAAKALMNTIVMVVLLIKFAKYGALQFIVSAVINGIAFAFFAYLLISSSGEAGHDYTYDDVPKRYNRIRLQMVELIKRKQLNNKDVKAVIEQLEYIKKKIDTTSTYRGPLDFLFNTFNPKDRRAKNSIQRQQAIEALFGNDLFIKSLELKAML